MNILDNLILGVQTAADPIKIGYCFLGVFLGTFIGVLPGIGSLAAVSMLLPVTYYLDPTAALIMLAGVYYGAEYGGSTASILLNLPGTPSSAVTCLDGYPMAKQGRAGVALFTTTIASFCGGSVGILLLIAVAPLLGDLALAFGPAEYFALMVFGLVMASGVAQKSALKGVTMVVVGLVLGTVGADVNSGVPRFTFGSLNLYEGLSLVALAMGLFGVSEIIGSIIGGAHKAPEGRITFRSMLPSRDDARRAVMPILRGSGIGSFFGALPGTGPAVASFVSYAVEKGIAQEPARFGHGAIEGVAAPEAANNAAVQTSFIPTLTLGIPGSASMAIMLGAMLLHGIQPGPALVSQHPEVFWGLVMSFWIGNLILLVLNIPLLGIWVRILNIPYAYIYPSIVTLICIGVYAINYSLFEVATTLVFGILGYVMRRLAFEPAPLLLGFVLGPILEENLSRALLLSRGNPLGLVSSPISALFFLLIAGILVWTFVPFGRRRQPPQAVVDP